MESNNKGTIYQQLNSYFYGVDNTINGNAIQQPQQQKIIIKGNSPEEIRKKGLELQQKQDLLSKFNKTTDRNYQKALQYEAARLPAYMDYEGMEYFPLISSALDLFMEESTTIGSNGKMLNIYSNNERIKVALEDLFYNVIKINVNLPFWTRNVTKYGDNFVLLYGERKQGITHVKQMVNYEVERIERIENGKPTTKFKERLTGSEFNIFEIAHFRLLGDDKFIPYGSCLASNSYIKTNKGVKQIKDINIGDVVIGFDTKSQKKIESKVLDTIYSGKKNIFKISTRHNYIDASKEHKILIYDNENNFRYEFVDNLKIGDRLVINTYDNSNEIIDIDKTEIFTVDKIKREFHYYQNINCIPDKMTPELAQLIGFMFGDGWISNNKDVSFALGEYDSQNLKYINLLEKFSGVKPRLIKPSIKCNYEYSQVTVGSKMLANILNQLGFKGNAHTKRIPSWVFNATREIRESFLNGFVDADGSTFIDKWNCVRYAIELCNKDLVNDLKYLVQSLGYKSGKISYRNKANKPMIENRIINGGDSYYFYFFKSLNHQTKNNDISNRLTNDFIIEPIISIEENGVSDVYDIHVDNENHNFYANNIVVHNSILNKVRRVFRQLVMAEDAMLTNRLLRAADRRVFKIDVGNIDEDDVEEYMYKVATKFKKTSQVAPNDGQIDYRFNILGNDEDYFLPLRNGNSMTGIDTLQGSTTLDAIHDIEYLRDNLFIGLGIPKPFLSFQDASGAGKNMAQFDVRFAKKVVRIQQAMIEELNKMAIIHLMLLGFNESDIRDFQLTLTNPSIQHDLLKSELLREQAQTYTELTRGENGIAAMSHTRAKRLVFNMSDVDIVEDLKQQKMEKVVMQELADAPILIKKSGLFADIDKKFGNETALIGATSGDTSQGGEMPPAGGPMSEPPMSGDMGGAPMPSMGGGGAPSISPAGGGELPPISEQFSDYIHNLVGLKVKENNNNDDISNDVILENEAINNATIKLLKETENIAEPEINIDEINID